MMILRVAAEIEPHKRQEFIQEMKTRARWRNPDTGCLRRQTWQDLENQNAFICYEEWSSRQELETYLQSDGFKLLFGAITVLGHIQEIQIIDVAASESRFE